MYWSGIRNLVIAIILLQVFTSCSQEDIVFRGIADPKVKSISLSKATITTDALFYNPNGQGGKVKDVEIVVELNGEKVADIQESERIRVKGNAEFKVPLEIEIPLSGKGIADNLVAVIRGRSTRVRYYGNITFRTFLITYKVPIDMEEDFLLKMR